MAFTQNLMRRGQSQWPPFTDNISLTIRNFHDASFNVRRLYKHVYPSVFDRDNILLADPICLYHPSAR